MTFSILHQAKNIRNKPVVNKDPQLVRMEEMQSQIEAGNRSSIQLSIIGNFLQALKEELIRTQTAGTVGIRSSQSEEVSAKNFNFSL